MEGWRDGSLPVGGYRRLEAETTDGEMGRERQNGACERKARDEEDSRQAIKGKDSTRKKRSQAPLHLPERVDEGKNDGDERSIEVCYLPGFLFLVALVQGPRQVSSRRGKMATGRGKGQQNALTQYVGGRFANRSEMAAGGARSGTRSCTEYVPTFTPGVTEHRTHWAAHLAAQQTPGAFEIQIQTSGDAQSVNDNMAFDMQHAETHLDHHQYL